ncbi:hypothetical protein [Acidilobus sp.]
MPRSLAMNAESHGMPRYSLFRKFLPQGYQNVPTWDSWEKPPRSWT